MIRFGHLDRESFPQFAGKPLLWILPEHAPESYSRAVDEWRPLVHDVSRSLRGGSHWAIASTNTHDFRMPLIQLFNVNSFPALVAQKKTGEREHWMFAPDEVSVLLELSKDQKTRVASCRPYCVLDERH